MTKLVQGEATASEQLYPINIAGTVYFVKILLRSEETKDISRQKMARELGECVQHLTYELFAQKLGE